MLVRPNIALSADMTIFEDDRVSLLRPEMQALSTYSVPDSEGYIKLDAMENPYSWPSNMLDSWLEYLRTVELNRYPDASVYRLKKKLRETEGIPDNRDILIGNGSDEIIQMILMALNNQSTVLAPEPTFVMYRQISVALGLRYTSVPLRSENFALELPTFLAAIKQYSPSVIFIAYPNNPTGNLFDTESILEIIESAPGLVVLDEAYAPYADITFLPYLQKYSHLLLMRTLSKLGLAGLRLGFLVGAKKWLDAFDKIRLPYNINILSQVSAEFALSKRVILNEQVGWVLRDRTHLTTALKQIKEVHVYESRANFILFRLHKGEATQAFQYLKKAGILIKNLHTPGGLLEQCLRVTVGTPEENNSFLEHLIAFLSSESRA